MIKKKFGKLLLAASLTVGAVGAAFVAAPTQSEAASSIVVKKITASYYSNSANALTTNIDVMGDDDQIHDFENNHTATFTIQDSRGDIVHRGSLNQWYQTPAPAYDLAYKTLTNISVTNLSAGHYRVKVFIPMDNVTLSPDNAYVLTQHFYINSDRTLSSFSE